MESTNENIFSPGLRHSPIQFDSYPWVIEQNRPSLKFFGNFEILNIWHNFGHAFLSQIGRSEVSIKAISMRLVAKYAELKFVLRM